MPLDFATKQTLVHNTKWLGVTPVPNAVLEQHKRAEMKKNPGDWGYKYPGFVEIFVPVSMVFALMLAVVGGIISFDDLPSGALMIGLAPLLAGLGYKLVPKTINNGGYWILKSPAKWAEYNYESNDYYMQTHVPSEISTPAIELQARIPGSWFVVGRLYQDSVVLDPYLLLCSDTDRVCLGIWKDDVIIHKADFG
jgi:hypothetical protein